MCDNATQKNNPYSEVAEYAAENGANDTKTEYSIPIPDIDATKSGTDATDVKNSTLDPAGAAKNDVDAAEMQNSATDPVGAAENDVDDGTVDARSDGNSTDSEAAVSDVHLTKIPKHIKATIGEDERILVILCLCYILRTLTIGKYYKKIANITKIKLDDGTSKEIDLGNNVIVWYKRILQCKYGTVKDQDSEEKELLAEAEKLLANILKLKMATLLRACVSVISYYKRKGQYFPHHFTNVRKWNNIEEQVAVLIHPKEFGKFTAVTYSSLKKLYTFDSDDNDDNHNDHDNKKEVLTTSDAVTSVMTDVVLLCFMDISPDLCMGSPGGKSDLVRHIDPNKLLKLITKNSAIAEGCARTAIFSLKLHKGFILNPK